MYFFSFVHSTRLKLHSAERTYVAERTNRDYTVLCSKLATQGQGPTATPDRRQTRDRHRGGARGDYTQYRGVTCGTTSAVSPALYVATCMSCILPEYSSVEVNEGV
jgi:hypothetical protein